MKTWLKIGIGGAILAAVASGVLLRTRSQTTDVRTVAAERTSITKEIAFTGRLEAAHAADLGFTAPGTVTEVLVKEGEGVSEGDVLVRLDSRTEALQVAQARAARASSQEETLLAWQQAQAASASTEAENARLLEQRRQSVRDAKIELDQAKEVYVQKVRESGDESSASRTALSTVAAAESAYHAAQQTLATAQKTVATQNEAANQAAEVARTQHVATTQTAPGVAGLSSLEAQEALAQVALSKNVIHAPFSGVVTNLDVAVGELALAGSPVVTMQTVADLQITADILESDVAAIRTGMPARVTFDALPVTETWDAHVSYIAPAARLVEGVPTYEITLLVDAPDSRLLPGLTANVTVQVEEKDNVIAIPRRAVTVRDGKEYVRIETGEGTSEERVVTTGLTGSDGFVEVTSGLSGGERIITSAPSPAP